MGLYGGTPGYFPPEQMNEDEDDHCGLDFKEPPYKFGAKFSKLITYGALERSCSMS